MAHIFRIIVILALVTVSGSLVIFRFLGGEEKRESNNTAFPLEKDAFDFSAIPVIDESSQEAARDGDTAGIAPKSPLVKKEIQQSFKTPQTLSRVHSKIITPPSTTPEKTIAGSQENVQSMPKNVSLQGEERKEPASLSPLNTEAILAAVVKIQCPTNDGRGKYIGSGFSITGGKIVTAAHVVKDSEGKVCDVIFPGKNRMPIHYLRGTLEDIGTIKKRHDEGGIDIAFLTLPDIAAYSEAREIFPSSYPFVPYSLCANPAMISATEGGTRGDALLHYGYPSNFVDQNYLSDQEGRAISYADVMGVKDQYSDDFSRQYKTPEFSYTDDESKLHPYMVSRVASFYGNSGGLAFNATKQCILGPHRGGTVGRGAGENYSIFPLLGWLEKERD